MLFWKHNKFAPVSMMSVSWNIEVKEWLYQAHTKIRQVSTTESFHMDFPLFPSYPKDLFIFPVFSFQVLLCLFAVTWIFLPQSSNGASKIKMKWMKFT